MDLITGIFLDGLFAAIAAIGFSTISNTPRRAYWVCALLAAIGHIIRYTLTSPGIIELNIITADTIAAFFIGLTGVLLAPVIHCPAEVCLYPALLPLIPGMYAYRTIEALLGCLARTSEEHFNHYLYLFCYNGFTCAAILLAMVIAVNIPLFALRKIAFQATR